MAINSFAHWFCAGVQVWLVCFAVIRSIDQMVNFMIAFAPTSCLRANQWPVSHGVCLLSNATKYELYQQQPNLNGRTTQANNRPTQANRLSIAVAVFLSQSFICQWCGACRDVISAIWFDRKLTRWCLNTVAFLNSKFVQLRYNPNLILIKTKLKASLRFERLIL